MAEKLYTDLDYSYLSEKIKAELEILFANTNLTRKERNKIVELLGKSFDEGNLNK